MKESIKNRIAVLLPYDELFRYAAEIAQEMKIDIIIRKVGTANAVEVAQKLKKHGIEIVIARGNLAKEIQDNVDVEVVRVVLTGFEFFELLWRYKDFKGPIGIIESKKFIYGCRKINKSLGLDLHYFQVDCVNDFSFRTQCAIDSGMKLLIGGSWGKFSKQKQTDVLGVNVTRARGNEDRRCAGHSCGCTGDCSNKSKFTWRSE